jgi:hypothetical protein
MSSRRTTPKLEVAVTDPQRGGYFDPVLTFRVSTRSPLPEYVSVARTGMEVRPASRLKRSAFGALSLLFL